MRTRFWSLAVAMAGLLSVVAEAGTYTWTGGNGDGKWSTPGNWNYDDGTTTTSPATSAPTASDNVVISNGGTVEYVPGGDLIRNAGTTMTISNGRLFQTGGINWPKVIGEVVIGEKGEWDFGTANGCNWEANGKITVNGGNLKFGATINGNMWGERIIVNSGSIELINGGEFKPQSINFENANLKCNTIAPPDGSVITFKSGTMTTTRGDGAGFYPESGLCYIDVPVTGDFSYTFQGTAANAYAMTFATVKFKYAGESIDATTFAQHFDITDNGDNSVTITSKPISETQPIVQTATVTRNSSIPTSIDVTASIPQLGGENTSVYLVYDTADKGTSFASWANSATLTVAYGAVNETVATSLQVGTVLHLRVIAVNNTTSESAASDPMAVVLRDYGVAGTVNEWIATSGNWTDGANWALGHMPTGDEIVWVENADAVISYSGNYALAGTEHFVSGTLNVGGELTFSADYTVNGFNFSCTTLLLNNAAKPTLTMQSGSVAALRVNGPNEARGGVYYDGVVNVISGGTFSWTFYSNNNAYGDTFGSKFKLDGASITESVFNDYFSVTTGAVNPNNASYYETTITLHSLSAWGLDMPTVVYDATSAKISTTVTRAGEGGTVYYVYGTSQSDVETALSNAESLTSTGKAAVADEVVDVVLEGLTTGVPYYAGFAIVAGGEVVAQSSVVSFRPSAYDAIYDGTTWIEGNASYLNNQAMRVYVTGALVYNNEVEATGKTLERAQLTMNGLLNYQGDATVPLVLIDSALISQRSDARLADSYYNLYPNDAGKRFIDFRHTTPSENTVHPASSYTFKYDNTQETVGQRWPKPSADDLFAYLFGGNRFLVDGATVSSNDAKGMFRLTEIQTDSKEEVVDDQPVVLTAGTMTLSTFDTFDATTRGAWTIENRGVVKLTTDVVLSQLTMLGTDSTVDLAGHALRVGHSGLTINGAAAVADGTYSAGALPTQIVDSVGGGSLVVRETKRLMIIAR